MDTCALTHLCLRGRETRESEWVGKEKQDLQQRGNKWQHPKDANLLGHCSKTVTMHVTYVAVSLDKLEPETVHGKLSHNMAAVFVNTKTHFGLKHGLSCSWNNSYCDFRPTLAHVTCVDWPWTVNPYRQAHSFAFLFENGEFAVTLIPALSLRSGLWSTTADHLSIDFQISHGFTLTLSAPLKFDTSLDRTSEGLLWLGTLFIHKEMSNSFSTLKMKPIMSSLSSLADHVLRKEPLTDSLSVNKTARLDFRKLDA